MKRTRIQIILAAAALSLFAGAAQAGAIIFDFGGSTALTCSSSNGSCAITQSNSSFLNLQVVNTNWGSSTTPSSLVQLLNYAVRDPYRITYWGSNTYVDLGVGIDTALILAAIKANSGLVDSLYWRPSYRPPGRFELRPVTTPHSIPEPGTVAMFAVALMGLFMLWRRQRALEAR